MQRLFDLLIALGNGGGGGGGGGGGCCSVEEEGWIHLQLRGHGKGVRDGE